VRRLSKNANDPRLNEQWGLDTTRIKAAWSIATGRGTPIPVAVIDSGIRFDHPDLAGRLEPGWDFVADDDDPTDESTQFAHGTSTASIIGASTDNGEGIAGVHWDARIIPVRAFSPNGNGTIFNISQAIRFAAGLSNDSGTVPASPAKVINLSFAAGAPATAEEEACEAARAAGALLVAASGNEGSTSSFYPAAYPAVMGIGATTVDNRHPSYSNSGSWVALAAPGGDFQAGVLCAGLSGGQLGYVSPNGTSFACPHVAGIAALVLSVVPLGVDELEQLLVDTAQDLGLPGPDSQFGAGLVDAYAALSAVAEVPSLALNEPIHVRVIDVATGNVAYSTSTTVAQTLAWSVSGVQPGSYRIVAGTDRNGDGELDDAGEVGGTWNGGATLEVAGSLSDLDFVLALK
jgi:serine protease